MQKPFFKLLFDMSFDDYITTKIIKILYIISIVGSGILGLIIIFSGFATNSGAMGIFFLILGPVVAFINIIISRVWLELIIVLFKIAENTSRIASNKDYK